MDKSCASENGSETRILSLHSTVPTLGTRIATVDGRNLAPSKKPLNDDFPVHAQKQCFLGGAGFRPSTVSQISGVFRPGCHMALVFLLVPLEKLTWKRVPCSKEDEPKWHLSSARRLPMFWAGDDPNRGFLVVRLFGRSAGRAAGRSSVRGCPVWLSRLLVLFGSLWRL